MKSPRAWIVGGAFLTLLFHPVRANEFDEDFKKEQARAEKLLAEWRAVGSGGNGDAHKELREQIIDAAVRSDQPGIVDEVAAGGDVAAKEIRLPTDITPVAIKEFFRVGERPEGRYNEALWVVRRMTKTRFEVWTPKNGWLFDASGKMIVKATPPRRDGTGREWYGAFLPDGRWVTTDLWDLDKTLYFFSDKGKLLKEIRATRLAPPKTGDDYSEVDLIGWARCDRDGKSWVVSIGSEGGRAVVMVTPEGKVQGQEIDAWKLCYPRDLEPKGYYISLSIPSDDGKTSLGFDRPGHGPWSGYPRFRWGEKEREKVIPGGGTPFGFLPGNHDVYIGAHQNIRGIGEDTASPSQPDTPKTWFFTRDGECRGWIQGTYLIESADGKTLRIRDNSNYVTDLDVHLKPISRERYLLNKIPAVPFKLFPDLQMGFFVVKDELILASW